MPPSLPPVSMPLFATPLPVLLRCFHYCWRQAPPPAAIDASHASDAFACFAAAPPEPERDAMSAMPRQMIRHGCHERRQSDAAAAFEAPLSLARLPRHYASIVFAAMPAAAALRQAFRRQPLAMPLRHDAAIRQPPCRVF
jgi:hypothetical protein